jgi:hypothetical protein
LNNSTNDDFHMQTPSTFPLQINTQNNISCLKQFNDFLKNYTFEFSCCVCNEQKHKHEFQICKIKKLYIYIYIYENSTQIQSKTSLAKQS